MIATFGKLDGDSIRFEPGLNVITAPNEWGKSTWCAFLTAMLYGVETKERTTRGQLADKEKYMPWSGRPMEGLLRIEHGGRDITIQRTTRGRVPMGEFRAYETRSGLPVKELTGENCGMKLLGVEKSVFLRTGFIRFSDLTLVPDESLWERLQALLTDGDENTGTGILGKRLRELKNQCRSPRGGRIPETRKQIARLELQLEERNELEDRQKELSAQAENTRQELEALERHKSVLLYREIQADRDQTEAAVQAAKDARDNCERLEEQCRTIPVRSELAAGLREAQECLDELQDIPPMRPPSILPTVLLGILAGMGLVLAAIFAFWQIPELCAVAAVSALVLGLFAGRSADLRREKVLRQNLEQKRREKRMSELMEFIARSRNQLALRDDLEQARRTAEETRIRLQSLVAMAKAAAEAETQDELKLNKEETMNRIEILNQQLRNLQLRMGQCQGRMETVPEREHLTRQLETERTRLRELERYERALEQGLSALEEAGQELRRRFAPRITMLAQDYLTRMTRGEYTRLSLGEDLALMSGGRTETVLRESKWRSDGTADLMYLALRLAVWVTLNPEGPLVLDDALVRLDDGRLEGVLTLLKELGRSRQIILFSCQEREQRML